MHFAYTPLPTLRPSPTSVNLRVQRLAYGLAVVDQPGECCPITGRNGVLVHDGVKLLTG